MTVDKIDWDKFNDWELDDEDDGLLDNCPNCGKEYDEIDREYQICHYCKCNANDIEDI